MLPFGRFVRLTTGPAPEAGGSRYNTSRPQGPDRSGPGFGCAIAGQPKTSAANPDSNACFIPLALRLIQKSGFWDCGIGYRFALNRSTPPSSAHTDSAI